MPQFTIASAIPAAAAAYGVICSVSQRWENSSDKQLRRWLQVSYNYDSTTIRPRYDHSTTDVTNA